MMQAMGSHCHHYLMLINAMHCFHFVPHLGVVAMLGIYIGMTQSKKQQAVCVALLGVTSPVSAALLSHFHIEAS